MEKVTLCGTVYVTSEYLVYGDHCNTGLVGKANVTSLLEELDDTIEVQMGKITGNFDYWADAIIFYNKQPLYQDLHDLKQAILRGEPPKSILEYGIHYYRQLWVREDLGEEIVGGLDDYPIYDENKLSKLELEAIDEAWNDTIRSISIELEKHEVTYREPDAEEPDEDQEPVFYDELWDALSIGEQGEILRDAMEETNNYWEFEGLYAYLAYVDLIPYIKGVLTESLKPKPDPNQLVFAI